MPLGALLAGLLAIAFLLVDRRRRMRPSPSSSKGVAPTPCAAQAAERRQAAQQLSPAAGPSHSLSLPPGVDRAPLDISQFARQREKPFLTVVAPESSSGAGTGSSGPAASGMQLRSVNLMSPQNSRTSPFASASSAGSQRSQQQASPFAAAATPPQASGVLAAGAAAAEQQGDAAAGARPPQPSGRQPSDGMLERLDSPPHLSQILGPLPFLPQPSPGSQPVRRSGLSASPAARASLEQLRSELAEQSSLLLDAPNAMHALCQAREPQEGAAAAAELSDWEVSPTGASCPFGGLGCLPAAALAVKQRLIMCLP